MKNKLPFEKVKRKIHVKKEAETNLDYGKRQEDRTVKELINYGVININKPAGPTSHEVSSYVQKILGIKKSGHSGTLDPRVTGCLPTALGKATRIVQTLLKSGKEYVALMHLHKQIPISKIHRTAKSFIGQIKQIPPIRSAVKRQERTREIYYLEILEVNNKEVLFKVGCEAGTYIRKLCTQFGEKLEIGAHMAQLIRTKAGPFSDKDWHSLHDLKDAYEFYKQGDEKGIRKIILPIEMAIKHLPKIWINDNAIDSLCHGADLNIPGISKLNEFKEKEIVAVMTLKDELICLGTSLVSYKEIIKKDKGIAIKTKKVFMDIGVYPKLVSD